ncbi:MAG: hypothetical protein D3923_04020 [Candidatus Electrothrix sp. AR3]|nr:hypothetical protein [Candidatus Electrothrix sp. AR3]
MAEDFLGGPLCLSRLEMIIFWAARGNCPTSLMILLFLIHGFVVTCCRFLICCIKRRKFFRPYNAPQPNGHFQRRRCRFQSRSKTGHPYTPP